MEKPKKILIAEDDSILRYIIEKRLEKEGYQVIGADDGQAAVDLAKQENPDLILLDIVMPKLNGFEVMKNLQHYFKELPPIVILTTSIRDPAIEKALSMGARSYIAKSAFDAQEITAKINKMFEKGTVAKKKTLPGKGKKKKSILIVEDDPVLGKLMLRKLQKLDKYNVYLESDGNDAFEAIKTRYFDLVLLDILLPGLSGFEILELARINNLLKDTPVIILSNMSQKEDLKRGMELGAKDYIIKSNFTLEEIVEKMSVYLEAQNEKK